MVTSAGDSLQPFSMTTSTATSMGGFFSGRKIERLQIGGIDNEIVKIAASELNGKVAKEELDRFEKSSMGFFTRSVIVSLGDKTFELNISSCAKRLGLTRKEVFDIAKKGELEKHLKSIRDSNVYQSLESQATAKPNLPKVAQFVLSKGEELLKKAADDNKETIKIPGLSRANCFLEIKDKKIYFIQKGIGNQFFEIDLTSHLDPNKAQDTINSIKFNEPEIFQKRVVEDGVNENFQLSEMAGIMKYVQTNKDSLIDKARMSPGQSLFIRPSRENGLARCIQVNGDGNVYVHFNKLKEGDKLIGEGSFKKVKFALHLNSGNILAISKSVIKGGYERSIEIAKADREIAFLKRFDKEPSIAKVLSHGLKSGKRSEKYNTLQPYYNSGDLQNALKHNTISVEERPKLALQMLKACAAVEKAGVIHRDIKPANFFLTIEGNQRKILLGDFGLACDSNDADEKSKTKGTPKYIAPEYVKSIDEDDSLIEDATTSKLDSWALGLTLYQMFGKNYPIGGSPAQEFLSNLKTLTQQDIDNFDYNLIPDDVVSLIKDLLQVDPKLRLTPTEAYEKYKDKLNPSS